MRSNSEAAGPAAIRGSAWLGTFGWGCVGATFLNASTRAPQRAELVGVDDLPHVREHLALFLFDVMADLGHQGREFVVERGIVSVELL
jgi:hypothetical protein